MIEIKRLTELDPDGLGQLIQGYVSPAKYRVSKHETAEQVVLTLELVTLDQPYIGQFDEYSEMLDRYRQIIPQGFSLGAYEAGRWVGVALAEPHDWNKALWVFEFHIASTHQRQGIGRQMMDQLAELGRAAGLRTMVCETQNTNVPAIRFYRQVGFTVEGVDLSLYTNEDFPEGEIAIFMKRRL